MGSVVLILVGARWGRGPRTVGHMTTLGVIPRQRENLRTRCRDAIPISFRILSEQKRCESFPCTNQMKMDAGAHGRSQGQEHQHGL